MTKASVPEAASTQACLDCLLMCSVLGISTAARAETDQVELNQRTPQPCIQFTLPYTLGKTWVMAKNITSMVFAGRDIANSKKSVDNVMLLLRSVRYSEHPNANTKDKHISLWLCKIFQY